MPKNQEEKKTMAEYLVTISLKIPHQNLFEEISPWADKLRLTEEFQGNSCNTLVEADTSEEACKLVLEQVGICSELFNKMQNSYPRSISRIFSRYLKVKAYEVSSIFDFAFKEWEKSFLKNAEKEVADSIKEEEEREEFEELREQFESTEKRRKRYFELLEKYGENKIFSEIVKNEDLVKEKSQQMELSEEEIQECIVNYLNSVYEIPKEKITPETNFKDLSLDSLTTVEIVMELENQFDINAPEETEDFNTISDIVNFIVDFQVRDQ